MKVKTDSFLLFFFSLALIGVVLPREGAADFYIHTLGNYSLSDESFIDQRVSPTQMKFSLKSYLYQAHSEFTDFGLPNQALSESKRIGQDFIFSYLIFNGVSLYSRFTSSIIENHWEGETQRGFSLTDQTLAANLHLYSVSSIAISLQAQVDFPFYDQLINQRLGVGDQSADFTYSLHSKYSFLNQGSYLFFAEMSFGTTFRSKGFSNALPYSGGLHFRKREVGIFSSLIFSGVHSFKTDVSAPPIDPPSLLFERVNPDLFQVNGELGMRFSDSLSASLSVTQTLAGKSAPQGTTYSFSLSLDFPFKPQTSSTPEAREIIAQILTLNPRFMIAKINLGSESQIKKGDVFELIDRKNRDLSTQDEVYALGTVISVKQDVAALEITDVLKDQPLTSSLIARKKDF